MFHSVKPQNNAPLFGEMSQIEFVIDVPVGRSIEGGTVCLQGDLRVNRTGQTRNGAGATLDIGFNHIAGGHGLIQSIQTNIDNGGMIESITNYGRHCKMISETSLSRSDLFRADKVCELVSPDYTATASCTLGKQVLNTGQTSLTRDVDFNIKPIFCLNRTKTNIPQSKTGRINVLVVLERDVGFLHGIDGDANMNFSISNVELQFKTVPSVKGELKLTNNKLVLSTVQSQKSTILSNRSNISCLVPNIVSSVYATFQIQNNEFTPTNDNLATNKLRNIESVSFLFNDSMSNNIVYKQESLDEIIGNYNDAIARYSNNSTNNIMLNNDDGFGVGMGLGGQISLLNNKLDIEINCPTVDNLNPYTAYIYFNGIVVM